MQELLRQNMLKCFPFRHQQMKVMEREEEEETEEIGQIEEDTTTEEERNSSSDNCPMDRRSSLLCDLDSSRKN
jgi:hypothetical protein